MGDHSTVVFNSIERWCSDMMANKFASASSGLRDTLQGFEQEDIDIVIYCDACWRIALSEMLLQKWDSARYWYLRPTGLRVNNYIRTHARGLWRGFLRDVVLEHAWLMEEHQFNELQKYILSGVAYK